MYTFDKFIHSILHEHSEISVFVHLGITRSIKSGSWVLRMLNFSRSCHSFPSSAQYSSVAQSYPTLCNTMNHSMPELPVYHQLPESTQTHVHWVSDAIQPSHPLSSLLLLPSIFPCIRVFSNESALRIRWPKYWSFSFSISPSNDHPGLIDLL